MHTKEGFLKAMDFKFSVKNTESTVTKEQVLGLFLSANISSTDYEFLIPNKHHRANQPPEGYISVYKDQIERGLRFPFHKLVLDICTRIKISPTQLTSNAHSTIVGFILSAKLHDVPISADYFFSLFSFSSCLIYNGDLVLSFEERSPELKILEGSTPYGWNREFFFLRPVAKECDCITDWRDTYCVPIIDSVLTGLYINIARSYGMLDQRFRVKKLIQKDVLVHGGIEPGVPSPNFTFRYLMDEAAVKKLKLLPEVKPSANSTDKAANKRPLSVDASSPNNLTDHSADPTASKVPIHDMSSSSVKDTIPVMEGEGEENHTSAHQKANLAVVSDENPPQSVPAPLLAISKTLESVFVPKECYEKLEKENQEITSDLMSTKSRVEELEEEIKLYKANRVNTDYRTSQAMVKVKILEKRLENAKSDSDKIKKDAIEEFKSSDDFSNAVHEEAVKYYINGFETCKMRLLASGKLSNGFNFDFLDVADAELESSPGPPDNCG